MAAEGSHFTNYRLRRRIRRQQLSPTIDEHSVKLPELFFELIVKILLRLPVKSLIRFKSVCKSWQTEISSPQFVKKHLDFVTTSDNINPWGIIVRYASWNLKSFSLRSLFHKPHSFVVRPHLPFKSEFARIVGSCNGLVCVYFYWNLDTFYIWNPSTKETHALSAFGREFIPGISFGFGYDSSNDDYKVVRVSLIGREQVVEVCSTRTDSWRRIGNFPSSLIINHFPQEGEFVNGSIHWAATNPGSHSWLITALNLSDETYREVPQPKYESKIHDLSIITFRGRLSILCEKAYRSVDLWVMNEYGIKDSWTKLVNMPYLPGCPYQCPKPLWCLKDGVILVKCNGAFGLYDSIERTFKYPLSHGTRGKTREFYQAEIYVESLISPNAVKEDLTGLDE